MNKDLNDKIRRFAEENPEAWDRLLKAIFEFDKLEAKYAAMTNTELADRVIERIWAEATLGSDEHALIMVVVDRLRALDKLPERDVE